MPDLRIILCVAALCLLPFGALAEDRLVRLYAPDALTQTGLLKHILPRFTLKTQVRVTLVPEAEAQIALGGEGRALFQNSGGAGPVWHLDLRDKAHPGTQRFSDWLKSDVGRRTILGFAPDGAALFEAPGEIEPETVEVRADGDSALGLQVSREKCTRCHAVEPTNRMIGIGSTPSFAVLRALPDWFERFSVFYILNPHPAFTVLEGVSEPFPEDRPSPIVPVEMTLAEFEAMMAYVSGIQSADLGPPLEMQ